MAKRKTQVIEQAKHHRGQKIRMYWPGSGQPTGSIVGTIVSVGRQTGGRDNENTIYTVNYDAQEVRSEHELFKPRQIEAGQTAAIDGCIIEVMDDSSDTDRR